MEEKTKMSADGYSSIVFLFWLEMFIESLVRIEKSTLDQSSREV